MKDAPEDPAFRIVRLALAHPSPSAELAAALAKLLRPRRVRRLLGPWNDARLATATLIAENALGPNPHADVTAHLAAALGVDLPQAAGLIQAHRSDKYPDGPRNAALELVGEAEGLTGRTVRDRIAKVPPDAADWLTLEATFAAMGMKKP